MLHRLFRRGARSRAAIPDAAPQAKRFAAPPLFAFSGPGVPIWTPRDFAALAREGYARNAVAFRCVRLVAEAAAAIPLILYEGTREADGHPLSVLLSRPNPRQGSRVLLETLYGHLLVAGNAYVEAVAVDGRPRELYALRPDRMRVVPGPDGWPEAYDYCVGAQATRLTLDGVPTRVLHLATFNPTDDYYGLSPIEAAATALDVHNAASSWNKALLDNSARPSGALVYAPGDGRNLTEAQFERLKEELSRQFEGARNAGRPMLLDGGLDWKALSLTPKDMDFVQAKSMAAREIALAFGVPPMLLGLPGDNTYSNYVEANRAFYRSTVLPLVGRVAEAMVQWLGPAYVGGATTDAGAALRLEPDLDRVEALSVERDGLWARVGGASFLTDAEKRQALGFGAADAARTLADMEAQAGVAGKGEVGEVKYDPNQPRDDHGRWTSEASSSSTANTESGAYMPVAARRRDNAYCQAQYQIDLIQCRLARSAACYGQAMERLQACREGRPIPPLNY
jgi:HK97 family phage portal protein